MRDFETQFMCGDALLVAPILREGGDVEIALPPGNWYDLNTRQRYAGRQVIRYRAKLDQFPVFGREGRVLPLGLPDLPFHLRLDALSAFFLLLLSLSEHVSFALAYSAAGITIIPAR